MRTRAAHTKTSELGRGLGAITQYEQKSTELHRFTRLRAELIDDEEEQARALGDLEEMERMIASTLSFALDDAVDQARETVDLMALVQRVCDSLEDTGLEVQFESRGRLAYACRPGALRRALSNLVENAARYGEKARVELLAGQRRIVIRIDDHGPGIPEDQVETVFPAVPSPGGVALA